MIQAFELNLEGESDAIQLSVTQRVLIRVVYSFEEAGFCNFGTLLSAPERGEPTDLNNAVSFKADSNVQVTGLTSLG